MSTNAGGKGGNSRRIDLTELNQIEEWERFEQAAIEVMDALIRLEIFKIVESQYLNLAIDDLVRVKSTELQDSVQRSMLRETLLEAKETILFEKSIP